jgi:hypothetical protein
MGPGVPLTVLDPDVEYGSTLFYGVGRVASLHCGGGCVLSNWAPFSRDVLTDGACITWGWEIGYLGPEVLFEGEIYVRLRSEYRGYGCFSSLLCRNDDYEGIWVHHDSAD